MASSTSGVKCVSDVKQEFEKLDKKHQYQYIIFKISDDEKSIEVEKTGERDKTFQDMKNDLPEDDCRYAVFDLKFMTKEQQQREKIIFIAFVPDNLPAAKKKLKMMYSSSKAAIIQTIGTASIAHSFQFSEIADFDLDEVTDTLRAKVR